MAGEVFTGKVEVGQNIRTSLAQLVAEELKVSFEAITMVMGDTDLTPWDMGTFGSRTIRHGAAVAYHGRGRSPDAAGDCSEHWHVDAAALTAADGKVTDPQNALSLAYGELTRGEKLVKTVSARSA